MRRRIKLYVSAGPDLERERDVIGRVVADLPVTAGWEIGRTPMRGQGTVRPAAAPSPPAAVTARDCDLFIFVLGQDISAPAGTEWDAARAAHRPLLALLKDVVRTPAGQEFQRHGEGKWLRFKSMEEMEREVHRWLVRQLLEWPERFGLTLPEIEDLAALAEKQKAEAETPPALAGQQPGGAGGGGIIISSPPGLPAR